MNSCRGCIRKRVWQVVTINKRRPFFFLFPFFFLLLSFSSSSSAASFFTKSKSCFPIACKLHFRWTILKGRSYYSIYVGICKQWALTCIRLRKADHRVHERSSSEKRANVRFRKPGFWPQAHHLQFKQAAWASLSLTCFCFLFNLQRWLINLTYLTQFLWGLKGEIDVNASWKL